MELAAAFPKPFFSAFFFIAIFITQSQSVPAAVQTSTSENFRGTSALAFTRRAVQFGERPSGSVAIKQQRDWILAELKSLNAQISLDNFQGQTPTGAVPMANILVKFAGTSGKAIAVTGHYDTLRKPGIKFVGANDGGSSTGFLLEFARYVSRWKHRDDIYIVFFDGEEAVVHWSGTDSRYGSRHLAAKWLSDGTLKQLKALINIDMIGDKKLKLNDDDNSSFSLREKVKAIALQLGYRDCFGVETGIDDDHKPFADLGVNVLDLIDLDFGPDNSYWHTEEDTFDKLTARSFQVVGDLTVTLVKQLDEGK